MGSCLFNISVDRLHYELCFPYVNKTYVAVVKVHMCDLLECISFYCSHFLFDSDYQSWICVPLQVGV